MSIEEVLKRRTTNFDGKDVDGFDGVVLVVDKDLIDGDISGERIDPCFDGDILQGNCSFRFFIFIRLDHESATSHLQVVVSSRSMQGC